MDITENSFYNCIKESKYIDNIELKEKLIDVGNTDYYSSSEKIFSDCKNVKYNITREGYIHITQAEGANYILYIDRSGNINLSAYYLCPESLINKIISDSEILYNFTNKKVNKSNDNKLDDLYNLNEFICEECNNPEPLIFAYKKGNGDTLFCKCHNCNTEYSFVPSSLYKMASKKIIINKTNTSRRINIRNTVSEI